MKTASTLSNYPFSLLSMETLYDRLIEVCRDDGIEDPRNRDIESLLGVSSGRVAQIKQEREAASISEAKMARLLRKGYRRDWIKSGVLPKFSAAVDVESMRRNADTPHEDDYAIVQQFHVNGSCGNGYMNDHVEIRGGLAFKRDWLARMKIDPDQASVIYARGDSMAPTLNDGEVLLIDSRQTEPISGRIYVLQVDGDLRVKRMFKRPGGWVIVSDSPDKARYPDEPLAAISDIRILGRVAWRGGGL